MTLPAHALLIAGVATLALYGLLLGGLALAADSGAARAVAGFVPDCVTLFRRLLADDRIPRRRKALVVALLGYLALPDRAARARTRGLVGADWPRPAGGCQRPAGAARPIGIVRP